MLSILVSNKEKNLHVEHSSGPIELGRGPQRAGVPRVPLEDQYASRDHLRVEELPGGRVRLENLSQHVPVILDGVHQLLAGASWEGTLPLKAEVGQTRIVLTDPHQGLMTITPPIGPPRSSRIGLSHSSLQYGLPGMWPKLPTVAELDASPTLETLARWMETILALQRSSASPAELYKQTSQAMIDLIGLELALVLFLDGDSWRVAARSSRLADDAGQPSSREFSLTVLERVVAERRTFYQDVSQLKSQESLRQVNAVVASPVFGLQDDVVGALYGLALCQEPQKDARLRPLEAQLVQLLASAVSANQARATATKIECDLDTGRKIQLSFLPESLPQLPGWDIGFHFHPAREVSGDFYDVFPLSGDHLALVIADVCNKGVGAALFMTLFRSLLRAFARQAVEQYPFIYPGQSASAVGRRRAALLADLTALSTVELTNEYVARTHASAYMFATLFFGVLDTANGALTYVNAGHDAPVLLGAGGIKARLTVTGPVVGIDPAAGYDIQRTQLGPDETLFTYTDGVTEARNAAGAFFTEKRLLALLASPAPSVTALINAVTADLHEHTAGAEPSDDVTLLAVRRRPEIIS